MYGTALGTAVLAPATFHMAQYTRKMIQESVYERGQARAIEFVALVIDPLIDQLQEVLGKIKKGSFSWIEYPLQQRAAACVRAPDTDPGKK